MTPGKSGIDEVILDAGGKILKTDHESSVKQAAQKIVDKIKR